MTQYCKNCCFLFIILSAIQCTPVVNNRNAQIKFKTNEYNFGELELNSTKGHCSFSFLNSGNVPLIIQDVKTSCGCTVPKWTQKPIKSGKKGEIKIKYDAGFPGVFHKTITVYYNGKNSPKVLTIKGKVKYPEDRGEIKDNE